MRPSTSTCCSTTFASIATSIELKTGKFKPEWAGKLNFYLSAGDDLFVQGPMHRPLASCSARVIAVRSWSTRCAASISRSASQAIA
jgi:hypothetical protein